MNGTIHADSTAEKSRTTAQRGLCESCQVDVFVVLIFSLARAGLDRPLDPQAHARLPRVELGDLRRWE